MREVNRVDDRKFVLTSILVLLVLSILVMFKQLISPAYFSCYGSDSYQYTSWAWQFVEGLREGVVYPRWTALNFWGYGSPTFVLYPPLVFYMVAVFELLGNSLITAMTLTKFFALFMAAVGMFLLVREIYPGKVALLTGVLYIISPFSVCQVYLGGAFTSLVSLMWLPYIVLFITKYIRSGKYIYLLYSGACYSGLILTHLINAYMFTFVVIFFILFMSVFYRRPGYLIGIPFIILTGSLLSAAYSLPVLYEKSLIDYKSIIDNFPLSDLFIFPNHSSKFAPDFFWRASHEEAVINFLLFFCITALVFLRLLRSDHSKNKDATAFSLSFVIISFLSLFLMLGPSAFIWRSIPFFKYINIPARWFSITAFSVVCLSAYVFSMLGAISVSNGKPLFFLALIFLSCALLDYRYIKFSCEIAPEDLIPVKGVNWLPEHLPEGVDLNRIAHDGDGSPSVQIVKGKGEVEVTEWKTHERGFRVRTAGTLIVRVRTFYFPGWTAYIDGLRLPVNAEAGTGAILLNVPAGSHALKVKFEDTPLRYYSKVVSGISFVFMACLVLYGKDRRFRKFGGSACK